MAIEMLEWQIWILFSVPHFFPGFLLLIPRCCGNTKFHTLDLPTISHVVFSWSIQTMLLALESILSQKRCIGKLLDVIFYYYYSELISGFSCINLLSSFKQLFVYYFSLSHFGEYNFIMYFYLPLNFKLTSHKPFYTCSLIYTVESLKPVFEVDHLRQSVKGPDRFGEPKRSLSSCLFLIYMVNLTTNLTIVWQL